MFLAWVPTLLAFWPGVFNYDMPGQMKQAVTGVYGSHHPPLHTLIIAGCLIVGQTIGLEPVTVYAVLQMLALSFAFARVLKRFIEDGIPNWAVVLTAVFFAFNPIIALFAINPTKDVPFAVVFILGCLLLSKMVADPRSFFHSIRMPVAFAVLMFLCCMFRNNYVYAFAVFSVMLIIILRGCWKQVLIVTFIPVLFYAAVTGPLYSFMNIEPGKVYEKICVPMEQIAKVVVTHRMELTDADIAAIEKYASVEAIEESFNPRNADPIKSAFDYQGIQDDMGGFVTEYVQLGLRFPGAYTSEFLDLHLHYWFTEALNYDAGHNSGYLSTAREEYSDEYYVFKRGSLLPDLYDWYLKVASDEVLSEVPVIAVLGSKSAPIWIMLFCALLLLARGEAPRKAMFFVLPILFWATYLLGPVNALRYIFPLMCMYPLFACAAVFQKHFFGGLKVNVAGSSGSGEWGASIAKSDE